MAFTPSILNKLVAKGDFNISSIGSDFVNECPRPSSLSNTVVPGRNLIDSGLGVFSVDILYVNFEEDTGMVTVQLAGSCVGCPSSRVTLKQGVENMLMHYIPEVTAVQALDQPEEEDDVYDDVNITNTTSSSNNNNDNEPLGEEPAKQKSYEERLAAAGIPFSD